MFRYTHNGLENYWVCDFETLTSESQYYKDKEQTKVWLAFAKEFNPQGEYEENSREVLTTSIEEFFDFFWKNKSSATLFFHNLSWDGECIKWYLYDNGFTYYSIEPEKKTGKGWTIIEDDNRIYLITVWRRVRYGNNNCTKTIQLYIRCSLALLVLGIEDLGKIYGHYLKGSINYDVNGWDKLEDVPQECIDYIKADVNIMIKPLIDFNKEFKIVRNIKKSKGKGKSKVIWTEEKVTWGLSKLTISSTAKNLFKAETYDNYNFNESFTLPYDIVKDLFNWYYGGLTTYNPDYQYKKTENIDGRLYDVNSMYPSVMMNNEFPIGVPEKTKVSDEYKIRMLKLMVFKADIKNDKWPALMKKPTTSMYDYKKDYNGMEPRYVKKVRNGIMFLFEEELESLKRFYHIDYEILDEYWFKAEPYFKNFVQKFYNKRQEYKKSGDKREFTMKILLNSCYGKFGQKPERESIVYAYSQEVKGNTIWVGKREYVINTIRNEENCLEELKSYKAVPLEHNGKHINVAIAACITMKARVVLQNAIWENKDNFLYCDTDSMFMIGDPKGIEIDKSKLGAWDLEAQFDTISIGGSKLYYLTLNNVIVKMGTAGINKKWAKEHLKQEDIIIINNELPVGSKLMQKKVRGGMVLIPTTCKLKRRL